MALPGCEALMAQRPGASNVTVSPVTVQVVTVVEAKLTVRPDEAVADTVNGAAPYGWFGNAPNVMVCGVVPDVTWKLCTIGMAPA